MSSDADISHEASQLVAGFASQGKTVATAESCTGGWIAKCLTDIAGSSDVLGYGIVSYSNDAKESLLGVSATTLIEHGAVSKNTVIEMAAGVLDQSGADLAVAVSGIAGPGGGSEDKPVGMVWIAWAVRSSDSPHIDATMFHLDGDREMVRRQTVLLALQGLRERLGNRG